MRKFFTLCFIVAWCALAIVYSKAAKKAFRSFPPETTVVTSPPVVQKKVQWVYSPPWKKKIPEDPRSGIFPQQCTMRHIQGNENSVPLQTNYSTIEILFATDYQPNKLLQMIDLRVHRFDNNQYGFNVGIGGRYIPQEQRRASCSPIFGANAYYDYDQAWLGYFQQIGFGLEVLGKSWDFRANAYIPIGPVKRSKTCVYDDYTGYYYAVNEKIEEVSYSFNGEVGCLAIDYQETWLLYIAGGPYYIAGRKCVSNTVGGELRIRPQYQDYVAIDVGVRYDPLFKWIYQIECSFNLPLYQLRKHHKLPCGLSDRQMYQPVQRFEVLPLSGQSCWKTNW